jgi:hypothetical protein
MNPEPRESKTKAAQPRSLFALWLALLGPPALWLTQFELQYALASQPWAERHPRWLGGPAIVALGAMALLAWAAWRERAEAAASPLDAVAGVAARNRFLSTAGLWTCALFALVTLAQALAHFFFRAGPP